jgi:hypothetical protein
MLHRVSQTRRQPRHCRFCLQTISQEMWPGQFA